MNDTAAAALSYAVLVLLPLSALLARRLPLSRLAWMIVAWVTIFAVGWWMLTLVGVSSDAQR